MVDGGVIHLFRFVWGGGKLVVLLFVLCCCMKAHHRFVEEGWFGYLGACRSVCSVLCVMHYTIPPPPPLSLSPFPFSFFFLLFF